MPSSSSVAQTSSGARSANRPLCSASRIAVRSAGSSARGWTRSRAGPAPASAPAADPVPPVPGGLRHPGRTARRPGADPRCQQGDRLIRHEASTRARCPRPRRSSPRAPAVLTARRPRSGPWPAPAPAWPSLSAAGRSARPADQLPGAREAASARPAPRHRGRAATRK